MAHLTDRRFEKVKPILDKYREWLHSSGCINCGMLESELRECLNIGYRELKGIMIDLASKAHYVYLGAYYMQFQNGPGPVSEFKGTLGRLYGCGDYDATGCDAKREAFWANAPFAKSRQTSTEEGAA